MLTNCNRSSESSDDKASENKYPSKNRPDQKTSSGDEIRNGGFDAKENCRYQGG